MLSLQQQWHIIHTIPGSFLSAFVNEYNVLDYSRVKLKPDHAQRCGRLGNFLMQGCCLRLAL